MMRSSPLALLALLAAGCSGATPPGSDGATGDVPDFSVAALADMSYVDLGPCGDPLRQRPDGGVCLTTVNGKLVDEQGAGLGQVVVTVCAGTCYFGRTNADGSFSVSIHRHVVLSDYALGVHGRPDRVSYYARLPPAVGDTVTFAAPVIDPLLPASGPTIALDKSLQTLVSGDVTLTLAQSTDVTLDAEDTLLGALGQKLRALTVADPTKLPFVDVAAVPIALYGFAPFEVIFSQKASLSFPNTTALPAGTPIDVLTMRSLVISPPPAGGFELAAKAHVSVDGKRIDLDVGEGVTDLTWIALRKGM